MIKDDLATVNFQFLRIRRIRNIRRRIHKFKETFNARNAHGKLFRKFHNTANGGN